MATGGGGGGGVPPLHHARTPSNVSSNNKNNNNTTSATKTTATVPVTEHVADCSYEFLLSEILLWVERTEKVDAAKAMNIRNSITKNPTAAQQQQGGGSVRNKNDANGNMTRLKRRMHQFWQPNVAQHVSNGWDMMWDIASVSD